MTTITVTKIENRLCNVCTRVREHGYIKEFRHWYCMRTHFIDFEVSEQFHDQMGTLDGTTLHLSKSEERKYDALDDDSQ